MTELAKTEHGVYARVSDLPPAVRQSLKDLPHALDTWRKAYNSAAQDKKYKLDPAAGFQVAWAAVKNRYQQDSHGNWHEKKNWKPAKAIQELIDNYGVTVIAKAFLER